MSADTSLVQGSIGIVGTMAGPEHLATRVRRILVAAIPSARVRVAPRPREDGRAFDVTVEAGTLDHRFVAGWAGEGWPADVEELLQLIPDVEVAVASNLSEGARTWLSSRGVGWADETGRAEIVRPSGLVIVRTHERRSTQPEPSARWSRSTLAVAEATLSGVPPRVESVERATGLSRNATATALLRLERLGFLERPGAHRGRASGRVVTDPDQLLQAYVEAAERQRSRERPVQVHRLWRGDLLTTLREEIAPAFAGSQKRWAISGAVASILLAPYLSDVTTLDLYVDEDLIADPAGLALRLGGRIVERGAVINVRQVPTAISLDGPVIDDIRIALPVRVYADLMAIGGRSAEAAQHLWEVQGGYRAES